MVEETYHGTVGGYTNHDCRCEECKEAATVYARTARKNRLELLEKDFWIVEHGLASTYGNWGCRCQDCTIAWRLKARLAKLSKSLRVSAEPVV